MKLVNEQIRELQGSKHKFKILYEKNPEAIVLLDKNFCIVDTNPRFEELFGYTREETRGKYINDLVLPEEEIRDAIELNMKARNERVNIEALRKRKDGKLIPVSISVAPLQDREEEIKSIAIYKDISNFKKIEEEFEKSKKFLEQIFNADPNGISVLSKDLTIIKVNHVMYKIYGENIIGKKCYKAYHNRDTTCPNCPSIISLKEGKPFRKVILSSGTVNPINWIELTTYPLRDSKGSIIGVIENRKDITERIKAEMQIKKLKEFNEEIVRNIGDGLILTDNEKRIVYVNESLLKLLDYSEKGLIGKSLSTILIDKSKGMLSDESEDKYLLDSSQNLIKIILSEKSIKGKNFDKMFFVLKKKKGINKQEIFKITGLDIEIGDVCFIPVTDRDRYIELLKEIVKLGFKGEFIVGSNPTDIKDSFIEVKLMSDRVKNAIPANIEGFLHYIEKTIERNKIYCIENLRRITLGRRKKEILKFFYDLVEVAGYSDSIFLLGIPEIIFDKFTESFPEIKKLNLTESGYVDDISIKILRNIRKYNITGKKPYYKNILNETTITYPTLRKRIRELEQKNLVSVSKSGRKKRLNLTSKGKRFLI